MSVDAKCQCGSCEFTFWSGHSHDEGSQSAICRHCLAEYELVPRSHWGPDYDELVPVHRVKRELVKRRGRRKHEPLFGKESTPTGQHVMAATHASGRGVDITFVDELECAECRQRGGIVLCFKDGEPCPRCRQGTLNCIEVLY